MKLRLLGLAALGMAIILVAWFATRPKVPLVIPSEQTQRANIPGQPPPASLPTPGAIVKQDSANASQAPNKIPSVAAIPSASAPRAFTPAPESANPEALIEIGKARLMFRDYRTVMGENPVGTNAEIMKAIMGGNSKGAKLGPIDGLSLNSKGELVDHWGTPYFFHQLSGEQMEIRSAGPDKVLWTSDDLLVK